MAHTTGPSVYCDGRGSNRPIPGSSLTWNSLPRPFGFLKSTRTTLHAVRRRLLFAIFIGPGLRREDGDLELGRGHLPVLPGRERCALTGGGRQRLALELSATA